MEKFIADQLKIKPWEFWVILFAFLLNANGSSISLVRVRQQISISHQYKFHSPQVYINCTCRTIQNETDETESNYDSKSHTRIFYNTSRGARCWINIRPTFSETYKTAYKLSHNTQRITFIVKVSNRNKHEIMHIPSGISRIKTVDDSIVNLEKDINIDALTTFSWFYGEENRNNLRFCSEINDVDETISTKLGWYRLNLTTDKYEANEKEVINRLEIDDTKCPAGSGVPWAFRAMHYYNPHGILQSNLQGKTLNEVMGGIVDNVIIDPYEKIISIDYTINSRSDIQFKIVRAAESFNFSASISVDRYENNIIDVKVYELKATQVNVEIGIPGEIRSVLSFYHEMANQVHRHRVSVSVIGTQWVCAYPTLEFSRCTCIQAAYNDERIVKIRHKLQTNYTNFSYYEIKTPDLKSESPKQLKSIAANCNIDFVIIVSVQLLLLRTSV